ncbi:MAG: DEAD/DEAH box helicase family protein [Candidatus Pacebacteria bacterium]|nr:DEAD/DEAH box helicase family protein [Candidatus Paceibacterota bacterium]
MSIQTEIQHAIKKEVGSTIYLRGLDYFRRGKVRKWDIKVGDTEDLIQITGDVRGSSLYHVTIVYDPDAKIFEDLDCTCPYGYACKHTVAVVLAYAQSLTQPTPTVSSTTPPETGSLRDTDVRKVLATLGLNTDTLPKSLIDQLLTFQNTTPNTTTSVAVPPSSSEKKSPPARLSEVLNRAPVKPFDLSQYVIMLHRHRRYGASLHRKNQYYQQTSVATLLKRDDLTQGQRTLFEYIQGHNGFSYSYNTPSSDPRILLPLIVAEGFEVVCNDSYYSCTERQITVDTDPPPINAQLVHEALPHPADPEKVRHEISLVLTDEREPGRGVGRSVWSHHGTCVIRETDTQLRMYTLTSVWADIIARVCAIYREVRHGPIAYVHHGTPLRAKELEHLPTLIAEASEHLALQVPEDIGSLVLHTDKPVCAFKIDFTSEGNELRVSPYLDYGAWQSTITETISRRHSGRVRYVRRSAHEHNGTHVLTDINGVLHYTRLRDKEEVAFYKELEEKAEELGFTKTLKSSYRGKTSVARYIEQVWPALRVFAQKKGYAVLFTCDTLPSESVSFRADFTSDVDTEQDWLHFDVNMYCGDEKVTLDKLYEYMASGASYWRKEDGTLVEVENRAELERLVRLLQSFRAHEDGGFEGKLHHAPELTYVMTSSPHYNTTQSKSLRDFMKRVESGKPVKKVRLPKKVKDMLRPYQVTGVEWLYFLRSYHFAGILADDMGLGKTLQALTVLALERVAGTPSLVVCPKSLLYNWKNEAKTFFPDLRVLVYDGTPVEREQLRTNMATHDLVVVSYSTLKRDADTLCAEGVRYNYAILDEAQYIKNHMTKMAQCVKEIPADYRLALTGTPLENHVFELWSIYDYLMPGFLGRHDHFAKQYHRPIMENGDHDALTHLRRKVESFMLRRTKDEVLAELPPKVEQIRECVLTDAQNVLYQQILKDVRGTVFSAVDTRGFKSSQIHILAGLTKLRQVCNHPALLTKDEDYTQYESAKLDACLELIEEVSQSERKVLVFSQFTGMLDILAHALSVRKIEYTYLSGKTRKRQEVIDRFATDPKVTAFLISMKAGGTGLNLTAADSVIVFDPWWNPSVENQAIDRAHRIGQTRSVNVYRLLTKGTIEDKIQILKRKKQNLFDAVVEESGELFKKLTWEDIRELFAD